MTPAEFRLLFPEFVSGTYSDPAVTSWLSIAEKNVGSRWGGLRNQGIALYTAHMLAFGMGTGSPSNTGGVVSAKSVDKVSKSYDTGVGSFEGAGHFNATRYGLEFTRLARMIGAGGYQL